MDTCLAFKLFQYAARPMRPGVAPHDFLAGVARQALPQGRIPLQTLQRFPQGRDVIGRHQQGMLLVPHDLGHRRQICGHELSTLKGWRP